MWIRQLKHWLKVLIFKMKEHTIAIVGATGLVGRTMLKTLEERNFPVGTIRLFASKKSAGSYLLFRGKRILVENLSSSNLNGVDIALFSAGSEVSKKFAPVFVHNGAVVIDNSSHFRLSPEVPLIVPEVNGDMIRKNRGIIANPNCSTIQLVLVLAPLHKRFKIKRVVISTYQSVSGKGYKALKELEAQSKEFLEIFRYRSKSSIFPYPIGFNLLPQIDTFGDNGYTLEEEKLIKETQKIIGSKLKITATAVRVPVFYSHCESVNIEFIHPFTIKGCKEILRSFPGVLLYEQNYPLPISMHERDEVAVGRIRRDDSVPNGLNLWIVTDNIRKGAALNAVQIAEELINE